MINKKKIVKTGYNICAKSYTEDRDLFKNDKYLNDLVKVLKKGSKILDIGCGSGVPIDKFLLEKGFDITGIDISDEQIRLAKQNLPKGDFIVGDMSQIQFPVESFDAIVSFYAIFHIPREKHLSLFKKIYKLLKPEGYILVTMGAGEWEGMEEDFHGTKMFWSHYGREKNIEIVKSAGFKIIYEMVDTSGNERHLVIFAQKLP